MNYYNRAIDLNDKTIEYRRHIHQLAECGLENIKTAEYVESILREYNLDPVRVGKSGVSAIIGKGEKTILLRGDMDALPMEESTGLSFASTNGNCHSCGHDMHTAMLLTAAKMLKENEENLKGCVKLMFQPGEEVLAGAIDMVEAGILENPTVHAAMAIHTSCFVPTGKLLYGKGTIASSCDTIKITAIGKGAHGASVYNGVDPINVIVHVYQSIQSMMTREINANDSLALTFGKISAGEVANVIPNEAFILGTIRTYNEKVRSYVKERIESLSDNIAKAFKAEIKIEYISSTDSLPVDPVVSQIITDGIKEILPDQVQFVDLRINGSEDFSCIASRVPSTFMGVGTGSREEGYNYPSHNPNVLFNEDAMPYGAAAYAQGATQWLLNSNLNK